MKYLRNVSTEGILCFLFSPVLMLLVITFIKLGMLDESTPVHPWLERAINWRYSFDGFFLMFFVSITVCLLVTILLKTQPMPRSEQVRLAKAFNFVGTLCSKLFLFWAGMFFAWSLGSRMVEFISPIPNQEAISFVTIFLAVSFKYLSLEFKHRLLKR